MAGLDQASKLLGKLEGKIDSFERQQSAVFKKLDAHIKDMQPVTLAAKEGLRICRELEVTSEDHEKRLNVHDTRYNRLMGWVAGAATTGGIVGSLATWYLKKGNGP